MQVDVLRIDQTGPRRTFFGPFVLFQSREHAGAQADLATMPGFGRDHFSMRLRAMRANGDESGHWREVVAS